MEDQDEHFMALAIEQAELSKAAGDVPFGAIVVCDGKVLAAGRNSEHLDQDVTCHAETKAVSLASQVLGSRNLSGCTIYSTVEPCTMCAGAIFNACIQRVVYAVSRDDLPELFRERNIRLRHLSQDWHYLPQLENGVLKDEAIRTFLSYDRAFRVQPAQIAVQPG